MIREKNRNRTIIQANENVFILSKNYSVCPRRCFFTLIQYSLLSVVFITWKKFNSCFSIIWKKIMFWFYFIKLIIFFEDVINIHHMLRYERKNFVFWFIDFKIKVSQKNLRVILVDVHVFFFVKSNNIIQFKKTLLFGLFSKARGKMQVGYLNKFSEKIQKYWLTSFVAETPISHFILNFF